MKKNYKSPQLAVYVTAHSLPIAGSPTGLPIDNDPKGGVSGDAKGAEWDAIDEGESFWAD